MAHTIEKIEIEIEIEIEGIRLRRYVAGRRVNSWGFEP
jgi:hypothetical protein